MYCSALTNCTFRVKNVVSTAAVLELVTPIGQQLLEQKVPISLQFFSHMPKSLQSWISFHDSCIDLAEQNNTLTP